MFKKDEIKRNLLGCLEIAIFMRQGASRFSGKKDEMLRSFSVLLFSMPITYLAIYYMQPAKPAFQHLSTSLVMTMFTVRFLLVTALFFLLVYGVLKQYKRTEHFFQFISASNWIGLISTFLFLPILWGLITGSYGWEEMSPYVIALSIYTYVYTAFMATFVLRLPWEMAGFIVICGLALNQTSLDFLLWLGEKLSTATVTL